MYHNRLPLKTVSIAVILLCAATRAVPAPTGMAEKLIAHLQMQKIPAEGAWFAATYRSKEKLPGQVLDARYAGVEHALGSAIYALVTREDFSALHLLQTDEIWHYYSGSALELLLLHPDGRGEKLVLGPDVLAGQKPQITVPRGVWQGAQPLDTRDDAYTLFGCTLAPSFEDNDFQPGYRDVLQKAYPAFASDIARFTRPAFARKPPPPQHVAEPVVMSSPSTVVATSAVPVIDVGAGATLQEFIGRNAKVRTEKYSVALFTLAPGTSLPTSHNKIAEETLLITAGRGEVILDQKTHQVAAGSTVLIAPQAVHTVKASVDTPLRFYAISVPSFSTDDYVVHPRD